MVVGIELDVWKEGDGMVGAGLRCSIWILALLRRLLHEALHVIFSMMLYHSPHSGNSIS